MRFANDLGRTRRPRPAFATGAAATLLLALACTLAAAQSPRLVVQTGHADRVMAVAFTGGGAVLVTSGAEGSVKQWDVATGSELRTFGGLTNKVLTMAVSADGSKIAAGGRGRYVRLWDARDGRVLGTHAAVAPSLSQEPDVTALAFTSGGELLAAVAFDYICLWDTDRGAFLASLRYGPGMNEPLSTLAFSRDGRTLASGHRDVGRVILWDVAERRPLWVAQGHEKGVNAVAVSQDGRMVASSSDDGTVKLWDAGTGAPLRTLKHTAAVRAVAFNKKGDVVASVGSDGVARLWDAAGGRELRALGRREGSLLTSADAVAFDPTGQTLAVGGFRGIGAAELWSVESGSLSGRLEGRPNQVRTVAFSPKGGQLAISYGDWQSTLWDFEGGGGPVRLRAPGRTPSVMSGVSQGARVASYNTGGTLLADGEGSSVRVWNVSSSELVRRFAGHTGVVTATAFSPDGKLLASGSEDATVRLWDARTRSRPRVLRGHNAAVSYVAFSPDSKALASASDDATIKIWNVTSGRVNQTLTLMAGGVRTLAFHRGGKLLASITSDNMLQVWNLETGEPTPYRFGDNLESWILTARSREGIRSVSYSPDGRLLAAATGGPDVLLWENAVAAGEPLRLSGHTGGAISVSFGPDSRTLASAALDGTVKLWNTAGRREICTLVALGDGGDWAVVNPEGRFDTNNLDRVESLHWLLPESPFNTLPLEIFMRQYYEPRLLSRLFDKGGKFEPVPSLASLNRVQPSVKIKSVAPTPGVENTVTVQVEVAERRGEQPLGGVTVRLDSGAFDLRLFRDGQLVGYRQGDLRAGSPGGTTASFDVKLSRATDGAVEFSAYAFNSDRVKSATDRHVHMARPTAPAAKGRAYIISIGVNAFEDESWSLSFAAADARLTQEALAAKLAATGAYSKVVPVTLTSDYSVGSGGRKVVDERSATKHNVRAALAVLAGSPADPSLLKSAVGADSLRRAEPEDLVIITFSSHGYTDRQGRFYLAPFDTGPVVFNKDRTEIAAESLANFVSSDELSDWVRDIDAGELVMVVDTCHSAAAVAEPGFKPGPMGSRGMGQLAYDKGMRILAASQADDVALEVNRLRQGLLTYALVREGLEAGRAGGDDRTVTLDEWLKYGERRVPGLYADVLSGKAKEILKSRDPRITAVLTGASVRRNAFQQPSLFDFKRRRREVVLAISKQPPGRPGQKP